jgi:hypothetical protein
MSGLKRLFRNAIQYFHLIFNLTFLNTTSISMLRIDKTVFLTQVIFSLIAVLVLAFKDKHSEPCSVEIDINAPDGFYTGSEIQFLETTKTKGEFMWTFDDNSQPRTGPSVSYSYSKPGSYTVTLLVNDRCKQSKEVTIRERRIVNKIQVKFTGPDSVFLNSTVVFKDITIGAVKREWRVENESKDDLRKVYSTDSIISCTFQDTGTKIIYLKVNQGDYATKTIFVKRAAVKGAYKKLTHPDTHADWNQKLDAIPDQPTTQKVPAVKDTVSKDQLPPHSEKIEVTHEQMQGLLKEVVENEKQASDFSKIFGGNLNIPVKYNGKEKDFKSVCKELQEIKKVKRIKKLIVTSIDTNPSTGCVISLEIIVEKKAWPYL